MSYATSAPGQGSSAGTAPPTCQNCSTSTTPLWRRDESGSVLCNACGLFLKLHGRPRPISLKTDVIKSRNRLKTGQNGQKKKSLPGQGHPGAQSEFDSSPLLHHAAPRVPSMTQVQVSDTDERHERKVASGSTTPSGTHVAAQPQHQHNIAPQHMFEAATLEPGGRQSLDHNYLSHTPYYGAAARPISPQPSSILNGSRGKGNMDDASPSTLKTRISELEVINELFRGRVHDLEQIEVELRRQLDEAGYREQELRRRIQDLEDASNAASHDDAERQPKRLKTSDFVNEDPSPTNETPTHTQNQAQRPSTGQSAVEGEAPAERDVQAVTA